MSFKEIHTALTAATSLFGKKVPSNFIEVYYQLRQMEPIPPFNEEADLLHAFYTLTQRKHLIYDLTPYWSEEPLSPLGLFATLIQFSDEHNGPLSPLTLPPEEDIQVFAHRILTSSHRLNIPAQFEILLQITNNRLLEAALIGALTHRIYARNRDTRAYPNITVSEQDMAKYASAIAHFNEDQFNNDPLGDTYYFWTHFTAAAYLQYIIHFAPNTNIPYNPLLIQALDQIFAHGTTIMGFVREKIARQPIQAPHRRASLLGRQLGIAVTYWSHMS